MEFITTAGNIEVPSFLALKQAGLDPKRERLVEGVEVWTATSGNTQYSAPSPLELLGLHLLRDIRGADWKATDAEIEQYLRDYYPDELPEGEA
jgi:hypothetical protein